MILQALTKLYKDLQDNGKIDKPGWSKVRIGAMLCIDQEGRLQQIVPTVVMDGKKEIPQEFRMPAPVGKTSGIKSNFLWENSGYILGISQSIILQNTEKDEKKKEKHKKIVQKDIERFIECKRLHKEILESAGGTVAKAILGFFDSWSPEEAMKQPLIVEHWNDITNGKNISFRVNDVYAFNDSEVCSRWDQYYALEKELPRSTCLITGENDVICPTHPPIKGVFGAQSSGAALVSFNNPSFNSYGKEQNYNAPIGKSAAFAYTSALNYLLADRSNVKRIGDATVVCWVEGAEPQYQAFTLAALFGDDKPSISPADIQNAVHRLAQGLPVEDLQLDPSKTFYILGLSPNAGRISVRFFYRNSFGKLMKNVNDHNTRLEIVGAEKSPLQILPLWALMRETRNLKLKEDSNYILTGAVTRAILNGGRYPDALIEQVMVRIKAERSINRTKAAIIKAFFLKNKNVGCPKEVLTVALNEESTNCAYTLGRMFAILEQIQSVANPGINATIKDKYFGSAAASPATIFPLLNNLCQKHLRKIKSDSMRIYLEKQLIALSTILSDAYPARLTLAEQGSFYLGYYHQTQKRYEKKEEK